MLDHVRPTTGPPKGAQKARPSVQQRPRPPIVSHFRETSYVEINCWAGISSVARKCKSFAPHALRRARVQKGRFARELACAQVACDHGAFPLEPQRIPPGARAHVRWGPSALARSVNWDLTPQQAIRPALWGAGRGGKIFFHRGMGRSGLIAPDGTATRLPTWSHPSRRSLRSSRRRFRPLPAKPAAPPRGLPTSPRQAVGSLPRPAGASPHLPAPPPPPTEPS